jgi:hypothetical protein
LKRYGFDWSSPLKSLVSPSHNVIFEYFSAVINPRMSNFQRQYNEILLLCQQGKISESGAEIMIHQLHKQIEGGPSKSFKEKQVRLPLSHSKSKQLF